ncbi:MAG: ligase-associated DNA damage response DEXH box helicase [Balneolales bacterium]|nr:ligase-associated DNA damage response DEXH box helicase [Balneolales bacterium]
MFRPAPLVSKPSLLFLKPDFIVVKPPPPFLKSLQTRPSWPVVARYFEQRGWAPFPFQLELWSHWLSGRSGMLNAPTGSGKTYAVWVPVLMNWLDTQLRPGNASLEKKPNKRGSNTVMGLRVLWITPLRALAKDTEKALTAICQEMEIPWEVARRTGDTSSSVKQRIDRRPPQCLITTPESLHILIAKKNFAELFSSLDAVIVDEWHELLASKRGVMTELGLAVLRDLRPELRVWGISATIGNMAQALDVLCGSPEKTREAVIIKADLAKKLEVRTLLPDRAEAFSWAGHIGARLIPKLLPILQESRSTLLFTNTRAQAEIWYQQLLDADPMLAGQMALHHGSLDPDIRQWVEDALHEGRLKLVVSTSSLDLGVDFSPVETVVQVGSPKGVARFLQRAGRSGHQPGATSRIWFVPTHAMEIIESAALQTAIAQGYIEERPPYENPLDLLVQFLATLAVGDGFLPEPTLRVVRSTYAYRGLTDEEWEWALGFLTTGGNALKRYDEYNRVTIDEDGRYEMTDKRKARRHRISIGTILADQSLKVKFVSGGYIGTVEESFISRLKPGDTFLFAGRYLEFVRLKDLTVQVRKSAAKKGAVSRWMGGRMQLSTQLSEMIRLKIEEANAGKLTSEEMQAVKPLLDIQQQRSALPRHDQLLIEQLKSREGWHLFFYPIEGRMVHEGLAALLAWRISQIKPISFSIAMNDYGFELLSPSEPPIDQALREGLLSPAGLDDDIPKSINASEMARRHFREIARISGLIFQGFPGQHVGSKHLQANSSLLFDVFSEHDPGNFLVKQSYDEIMTYQLETQRLARVLERISAREVILTRPERATPFAFPIMVDRLRAKLTSEKLQDRIQRMKLQLEK